jgi:hypothetical protein
VIWRINEFDLLAGGKPRTVTISAQYVDGDGRLKSNPGPDITYLPAPSQGNNSQTLKIVLPIVIVLAILAVAGGFFWYRRQNQRSGGSTFGNGGGQGYGIRKSRIQRVSGSVIPKGPHGPSIRLDERPSPTSPGTNVFRDELRRQDLSRS